MKLKMKLIFYSIIAMVMLLSLNGCIPVPLYPYNSGYYSAPSVYYSPGYSYGYYGRGPGGFYGPGFGHGFGHHRFGHPGFH